MRTKCFLQYFDKYLIVAYYSGTKGEDDVATFSNPNPIRIHPWETKILYESHVGWDNLETSVLTFLGCERNCDERTVTDNEISVSRSILTCRSTQPERTVDVENMPEFS